MTWVQERRGERRPERDHDDGPAGPGRDHMPSILVVEDHAELQRELLMNLRARWYHPQLLNTVWGPGFQERTNYLRFHLARLRRKLEDEPARPRYLLTEPGMGYR
jgi:two-component system, OmpR family, KDP operon response regulator KdpE